MTIIANSLPDLAHAAKLLKISVMLEDVSEDTIFGLSIKIALRRKNLRRCIEMIRQQAADNRQLVSNIVGEDLLKDILSL